MEARQARATRRGSRRFNDVRKLANDYLFEFHDAIRDLAGATPARLLVIRRGLEYLDRLSADAGDDPALMKELAAATNAWASSRPEVRPASSNRT